MGDDTWQRVFPDDFYRIYPFDSFDIADLDSNDNGVMGNLIPELQKNDWNLLIG